MGRKQNFDAWVHTAAFIPEQIEKGTVPFCPMCDEATVDFMYGGDRAARIGYGLFWCNSCNKGIHISRLTIPDSVPREKIIDFSDSNGSDKLAESVPDFERLTP